MAQTSSFRAGFPGALSTRIAGRPVYRDKTRRSPRLSYRSLRTFLWSALLLLALLGATQRSQAQSLASVTVLPTSVTGGVAATGTITLTEKAPKDGVSIAVSSSNTSAATVPSAVIVSAGKTSRTFKITTLPVSGLQGVTITATYDGVSQTANLTVDEPAVASISVAPKSISGGVSATGKITLTGKAPTGGVGVSVAGNSSSVTVPPTVLVPAGKTIETFRVTTQGVATSASVTITATYDVAATTVLTVNPATLADVSVLPATVTAGQTAAGKITLAGEAPAGGASVTLTSSDTSVATIKSPIVVAANKSVGDFSVVTTGVSTSTPVTITATYNGMSTTATITVNPSLLQSVSVLPGSAAGGAPVTGTVTLSSPAPSGGVSIAVKSSRTALAIATSPAIVPAGQTSATFAISTNASSASTPVTISATYAGITVKTTLTVAPAYTTEFGQGYVNGPFGIAIDPVTQDIYVCCTNSTGGSVVKFDRYYDYLFTFGASYLKSAVQPAIDSNGNVYVGDYFGSQCVEFDANGNYIATFNGASSGVTMDLVTGVAVDEFGNVYVLDYTNARVVIFTPDGKVSSQFNVDGELIDIALDGSGNLWVAEEEDHVLGQWSLGGTRELIAGLGNFSTQGPFGLYISADGYLWATDEQSGLVQQYTSTGSFVTYYKPQKEGAIPTGIAVTHDGHVLVSEGNDSYVEIFLPNPPY